MMSFPLILTRDVDLKDVGVRQVAYSLGLCSFIFTGGQYPLKDRDDVIESVLVSFQERIVNSQITVGTDLQVASLAELQIESTSVGVNTLLIKREC